MWSGPDELDEYDDCLLRCPDPNEPEDLIGDCNNDFKL